MDKKIAIVTGASQGIGKSVAEYLASSGYFVILLARNEAKLQQVANAITTNGGQCAYYSLDVANAVQVQSCIEKIIQEHGQIDVLFNNAGIWKQGTSDLSVAEIDTMLKTNLNGAIYVASSVAQQMKKQRNGYIINLSSIAGKIAQSFSGVYSASKFGLSGFSESLSKEMSLYGVKVTNICPGMVATDMSEDRSFKSEWMIDVTDINKTVGYLLSLSKNAVPVEIVITGLPFIEKTTQGINAVYGIDKI